MKPYPIGYVLSMVMRGAARNPISDTLHILWKPSGIPAKLNAFSEGKPNGIPG